MKLRLFSSVPMTAPQFEGTGCQQKLWRVQLWLACSLTRNVGCEFSSQNLAGYLRISIITSVTVPGQIQRGSVSLV